MDDPGPTLSPPPPLPIPQSVLELENLIQRFYGLNTPQGYTQIDTCLKSVQKSHSAFALADQLLNSSDANVRFFGALTFTVKIKRDWASLTSDESKDLLNRLLFWFIQCVNGKDIPIVIRKLCTALVAVFKQTNGEWALCVRHIILCLTNNSLVDYTEAASRTNVRGIVASLSEVQATACLWLGSALVERWDTPEVDDRKTHNLLITTSRNLPDLLDVMECCLVAKTIYSSSLAEEAIKLLHTIQAVAQPLSNDDDVDGNNHRISNLKLTLASELAPNELLCTIAELFIDTVGREDERKLEIIMAEKVLSGPFQRHQQKLMEGDFSEDNLAYAQLMLKVGGLWLDHMAILEPHYQANLKAILERLIILISAEGCPIEEDTLITELVIFWSSFVEWALDLRNSSILGYDQCCQWNITSIAYTNRVIEAFLKKLQLPSSDLFLSWDKQTQSEFRSLRRDFRDFSASAYILLGTDMFENLVNYISRLWADQDWQGVEMALQCLKGIIENFAETEQGDASLLRFLSSPAFSNNNDSVPINIRQSNLELVADCSPFFERQSYAPMDILQWLFEALNHQGLSISSAKAISKICDSCRKRLSSNALALASLYCSLDSNNSQQNDVLEKLALAVGAVIQASWSESRNLSSRATPISALDEMLSVVFRHLLDSVDITTAHAKDQRISTLQCLVNLARSFRDIEHEIIDLEADQSNHSLPDPTIVTWISTRQEQFLSLLSRLLQNFPSDGDLMEMVCLLIRAGTTDDLDNPFRVNGEVFICLVGGYLEVTERPRFLLETTSRWLRPSLSWVKNTSEINQRQGIARSCLLAGMSLLGRMYNAPDGPSNHADHISGIIEFIGTFITTDDVQLLLDTHQTVHLFVQTAQIAIQCFALPEPTLKQAASAFWTKILDLKPTNSPSATTILQNLTPHIPLLAKTLLYALSGLSPRSDLDTLLPPFRRLITLPKHPSISAPSARTILSEALFAPDFPSTRVSDADKKIFLERVLRLRGSTETGRVVRVWWVTCRGTFT